MAVDFEAASSGENVGPELVEAGSEVVALFSKKSQALAIAVRVARRRIGAIEFFFCVEDFEGEDGEAVDHQARALGVQLSLEGGPAFRGGDCGRIAEEHRVAPFGEVVADLVEAVDGALDLGDVGVGGAGGASAVLHVPEIEVRPVLGYDRGVKRLVGGDNIQGIVVPEVGGAVLEGGDFDGGEVEGFGHALFEAMVEHQ